MVTVAILAQGATQAWLKRKERAQPCGWLKASFSFPGLGPNDLTQAARVCCEIKTFRLVAVVASATTVRTGYSGIADDTV